MRITLLRHAQTSGNLLGQYAGRTDLPLCAEGRARARCVPLQAGVERVYTSCMLRAAQTVKMLYPNAEILRRKGLNEMDFGRFEGKRWRDMEHDPAYQQWVDAGCEAPCPGGEGKAGFTRRCVQAFMEIVAAEARAEASKVHLVVHGGTIMAVMSELARPARPYFEWPADYCGGYRLEFEPEADSARPMRLLQPIRPKEGSGAP